MKRREFVRLGVGTLSAFAAVESPDPMASGRAFPQAVKSNLQKPELLIGGSFLNVLHPNPWDATYWWDTCLFWGEKNWRALIRDMHEIGMDTVLCINTAFWGRPLFPGYDSTVGIPLKLGCEDPLGACADEADRLGMKMFFGIGLRGRVSQVRDYADMKAPWPEVWFKWNTALAQAIVDRYGKRPSFAGLYLAYEIDFLDYQVNLYEKFIKQYLRPALGDVKLLASPGNLGDHPDLSKLPKQLERMGFNILAPQDYGGRSPDINKALELVRANARALESVARVLEGIGVRLWSNCELFYHIPTPDGRAMDMPGPFERIKQQIAIQAPFVEKLICYQYQGIMSRHSQLVNIGHPSTDQLYRQYVDYLRVQFPDRFKA